MKLEETKYSQCSLSPQGPCYFPPMANPDFLVCKKNPLRVHRCECTSGPGCLHSCLCSVSTAPALAGQSQWQPSTQVITQSSRTAFEIWRKCVGLKTICGWVSPSICQWSQWISFPHAWQQLIISSLLQTTVRNDTLSHKLQQLIKTKGKLVTTSSCVGLPIEVITFWDRMPSKGWSSWQLVTYWCNGSEKMDQNRHMKTSCVCSCSSHTPRGYKGNCHLHNPPDRKCSHSIEQWFGKCILRTMKKVKEELENAIPSTTILKFQRSDSLVLMI